MQRRLKVIYTKYYETECRNWGKDSRIKLKKLKSISELRFFESLIKTVEFSSRIWSGKIFQIIDRDSISEIENLGK